MAQFDWEKDTILEADSSGYATGGVLSQFDEQGVLKPCAFYSKKNSPAESNYEIHDKELLAIIRCLEEWDAELRSLARPFIIYSDHRNLQYFMKKQRLNERQIRWSLILSRYNFILKFRPGSVNQKADILSRREQDIPQGQETKGRLFQLLKSEVLPRPGSPLTISVARLSEELEFRGEEEENDPENDLESEDETKETLEDKDLPDYLQAAPPFPGDLKLTKL